MHDKSFLQALQDIHTSVSGHVEEAIQRMLLHRMTATHATEAIQDERMRAAVTNELMTAQIIALLALLKESGFLDETQYAEFTAYLQRSLISHHINVITGHLSA